MAFARLLITINPKSRSIKKKKSTRLVKSSSQRDHPTPYKMATFTVPRSQLLSADKMAELRHEAKSQYYQSHVFDLAIDDVTLEDFINDYIEDYYCLRAASTRSSVLLASDSSSTKSKSKLRRFFQRITRKKL
ncbi:hypothetical protein LZ31DRAFT_590431 [Colletotrichum somersetense]|nr:hypothetical protein LZ31DRAFT_590431 [Colletotrichum somersetense]